MIFRFKVFHPTKMDVSAEISIDGVKDFHSIGPVEIMTTSAELEEMIEQWLMTQQGLYGHATAYDRRRKECHVSDVYMLFMTATGRWPTFMKNEHLEGKIRRDSPIPDGAVA